MNTTGFTLMANYSHNRNASWHKQAVTCLLLMTTPVMACDLPNWQARYNISKFGTNIAKLDMTLQQKNGVANYRLHTEAVGLLGALSDEELTESSELKQLPDQSWALQSFTQQRKKDQEKNQSFHVINENDQIHVRGNRDGKAFELQPPLPFWDRTSVQLALTCDLLGSTPTREQYRYTIVDDGKITHYTFKYLGTETIRIADKTFAASKLERASGKRSTLLWLDPADQYKLLRMEQYKEDELKLRMNLDL